MRDLFFRLPYIGMLVGIVRRQVRQLRFQLLQFLVHGRQLQARFLIGGFGPAIDGPVLAQQRCRYVFCCRARLSESSAARS